jgi:hypothetical protein
MEPNFHPSYATSVTIESYFLGAAGLALFGIFFRFNEVY